MPSCTGLVKSDSQRFSVSPLSRRGISSTVSTSSSQPSELSTRESRGELLLILQIFEKIISRLAERHGYLTTVLGRRRYFPHISSSNTTFRAQAQRQAFKSVILWLVIIIRTSQLYFSFLIQGSAADVAKTGLLRSEEKLAEAGVESVLVMMIHDEMVWEVRDADLHTAAAVVKETLESSCEAIGMPLETKVRIAVGKSWGDLRELGS